MWSRLTINEAKIGHLSGLFPIFISSFGLGMALGGYIPLVAMWLESIEVSFSSIGLITGSSSIGVIVSAYLGPRLVQRIGYLNGALYGIILASIIGVIFRFCTTEPLWICLRILAGFGFGTHWVISEAWLGQIVSNRYRTKATSMYVGAMALGFSLGPCVIWVTGISTITPFIILGALQIFSVLPLLLLKNVQPRHGKEILKSPFFLIKSAPTIAAGVMLVGMIDLSIISLIPALVQKMPMAILVLSFLLPVAGGLGCVALQYPLAILSEKIGNLRTTYYITILGVGFCAMIPFFLTIVVFPLLLSFFGCGLIYFMYTLSLSRLSKRFKGNELISANASFIILFEISSFIGPLIGGLLLDKSLNYGLSTFLVITGGIYVFIIKLRANYKAQVVVHRDKHHGVFKTGKEE